MQTVSFPKTDLSISEIGLGTGHFGTRTDRDAAFRIMDRWVEAGGTLIDTAHIYGAKNAGEISKSEAVIGEWLQASGMRDRIVLCTKGAHPDPNPITQRHGKPRLKPALWKRDLEMSLDALQTDTVDLYFLHRDDPHIPVGELIEALEECVRAGKIRYYACSNWTAERMRQAADYAASHGAAGFVCDQIAAPVAGMRPLFLSSINMTYLGGDILAFHEETKLPVMSAMSLCNGYFHKRIAGVRMPFFQRLVYDVPANRPILAKLTKLHEAGVPLNAALIRFIRSWSFPTCALIGFSSVEQLNALLADYETPISAEDIQELHELRGDLLESTPDKP